MSLAVAGMALALVGAGGGSVAAQSLTEGIWEGTTILPNGSRHRTNFDVVVEDTGWSITYHYVTGPVALRAIRLDETTLADGFVADGASIRCRLAPRPDGGYTGACRSGDQRGWHTIRPPT